jgi:hypothetical protein
VLDSELSAGPALASAPDASAPDLLPRMFLAARPGQGNDLTNVLTQAYQRLAADSTVPQLSGEAGTVRS